MCIVKTKQNLKQNEGVASEAQYDCQKRKIVNIQQIHHQPPTPLATHPHPKSSRDVPTIFPRCNSSKKIRRHHPYSHIRNRQRKRHKSNPKQTTTLWSTAK